MHEGPSVPVDPDPIPSRRARARGWVALASAAVVVACVLGVWFLQRLFVGTWAGQRVEDAALDGAAIGQGHLWRLASPLLQVVSVGFVAGGLLAAAGVALARRRLSLAVQVAVLVGGANLTTKFVKESVLDRPVLGVGGDYGNTLPSGHTTAAGSVAAALLLVAPPRARPLVAVLGGGYTALTGISTLVGQWHRPSDVVAGALVVLGWTALVCGAMAVGAGPTGTATAMLRRVDRADPAWLRTRRTAVGLVVLGLGAGVTAVVLLARTWSNRAGTAGRADELLAYGGGVASVVAACSVTFAMMLLLRHAAGSRDETPSRSA